MRNPSGWLSQTLSSKQVAASVKKSNRERKIKFGLAVRDSRNMTSNKSNSESPANSSASSSSGLGQSNVGSDECRISSANSRKLSMEKENTDKCSMRSLQTPLKTVKSNPFSIILSQHNKVGSSFASDQQNQQYLNNVISSSSSGNDNVNNVLPPITSALGTQQAAAMLSAASLTLPVQVRKVRDSGALLFMLAFLGFLGYIIWDGVIMKESDVNLIVHGHDSYGNICGRNNRPIKFASKSGQNYTAKPYTKYTLINSQFERYTLDTSRLKKGELVYVKETQDYAAELSERRHRNQFYGLLQGTRPTLAPSKPSMAQPQTQASLSSPRPREQLSSSVPPKVVFNAEGRKEELKLSEAQLRVSSSGGLSRPKRAMLAASAGPQTSSSAAAQANVLAELSQAQRAKNHTLLTAIKSNLMYQYPPMYGYSSERVSSNSGSSISATPSYAVSVEPSALAVGRNGLSRIDQHKGERDPIETRESINVQQYNSKAFNDSSDKYDHVLVTPISVMTSSFDGRQSVGSSFISSSEATSQLLYLTECVSSCPNDHVELIFYRCLPNEWHFSLFPNAINVTRTFIDDILTDMSHCYKELIYTFSLALVLSLGLLILLRFLASIIIWSCILTLISLFLSMAIYSWLTFYYQILDLNAIMPHDPSYNEKLASSDKWLIGSIFLTFIAFAMVGVVIFMRKRILLVTMLFRESGKAIADMPWLLLQPLLTFGALVGIMILWSIGLICLQSIKKPVVDMSTSFVVFKSETLYKIMKWYHIFAFLWVSHFAINCQHYVIGSSVSKWYFSSNRYELSSPIGNSVSELILYYFGSVALGSFLVAIFKVIRVITRQIQFLIQRNCISATSNSTSAMQGLETNALTVPQATSASCCGSLSYIWRLWLWFLDNVVMIINRDAYVEIAIHGSSFLVGARRAFTVLASNPLRLLAIKSVGNLLLVVAKICVVFGTVSIAYVLLEDKKHSLNYAWSPIVVSAIYAYIVAHWFLSVYEMVIDSLFICYCEDFEMTKNHHELARQIRGSAFMSHILATNAAAQTLF